MKFLEGTAGEGGRSARTDSIMAGKCYWLAAMHLCRDGLMRNVLIRDCLPALTDSGASRRPATRNRKYRTWQRTDGHKKAAGQTAVEPIRDLDNVPSLTVFSKSGMSLNEGDLKG